MFNAILNVLCAVVLLSFAAETPAEANEPTNDTSRQVVYEARMAYRRLDRLSQQAKAFYLDWMELDQQLYREYGIALNASVEHNQAALSNQSPEVLMTIGTAIHESLQTTISAVSLIAQFNVSSEDITKIGKAVPAQVLAELNDRRREFASFGQVIRSRRQAAPQNLIMIEQLIAARLDSPQNQDLEEE